MVYNTILWYNSTMMEVIVNSAVYYKCTPDWQWDTSEVQWRDFDLWFIEGGEGWLQTPERSFQLSQGSCFVLRPQTPYLGTHNPDQPLRVYAAHFIPPEGVSLPLHVHLEDSVFFAGLFNRLVLADKAEQEYWMSAMLIEYRRAAVEPAVSPTINELRIHKAEEFIRENIDQPLTIEMIARLVNLSRNQLMRIYKSLRNRTILEYVQEQRIETACNNLKMTTLPIKRIAQLSGYSDASFFCRQFRRMVGCTPTSYRERRLAH